MAFAHLGTDDKEPACETCEECIRWKGRCHEEMAKARVEKARECGNYYCDDCEARGADCELHHYWQDRELPLPGPPSSPPPPLVPPLSPTRQ